MFNFPTSGGNNCFSCSHYLSCKDPHKSVIFVCDRFKKTKQSAESGHLKLFDALELTTPGLSALTYQSSSQAPALANRSFDIKRIITEVLDENTTVSPDIKINDRDFPQAPNFFTWCVSDKFLKQKPYLEQALIGTKVFADYCPRCSDVEWMDDKHSVKDSLSKFLKKVALLEFGICPHCGATRSQLVRKHELNYYMEAAICAGQRSGKSALLGMMFSYLIHWLIKLQNPNEVYGLLRSNVLHITFVALTYAQAKDTLWEPVYGYLTDSSWFAEYHAFLDDLCARHGEELYKLNDTFVQYKHRKILAYPAGPDKRTLRGRTRSGGAIDELGWFDNNSDTKKVKMNANEVYIAVERSLLTVRASSQKLLRQGFNHVPSGYFLNISSPSSFRDKIMELVRKSVGSRKIYGLQKPTWEMNPTVPKSALSEEFRIDPVAAMRDYGAQPPLTSNAFITSKAALELCIGEYRNMIKTEHKIKKLRDGTSSRYAMITKVKSSGRPSVLAIDAGLTNNSFACTVASLEDRKYPRIDLLIEIQPLPGVPLNYSRIYKFIISKLIRTRNVQLLAADRWNSAKVLSDAAEEHEIYTKQYSLKYADMQLFKSFMLDSQILFPEPVGTIKEILAYDQSSYPACFSGKPVDHFILQLLTVQDTGTSVIKGDQLTDDLVRSSMLAFKMLLDEDYASLWDQEDSVVEQQNVIDVTQMAVMQGASVLSVANKPAYTTSSGKALGMGRQRNG